MAKIIPKLNLNRTPQTIDNYSLVAAKNIKLNKDNSFSRDIGISSINVDSGLVGCISHNTKLYLFHTTNTEDGQYDYIKEYDETTGNQRIIESGWHYSGGTIDGKVVVNLRGETLLIINEYFDEVDPEIKIPVKTINLNTCSSADDESIYTQTPKLQLFDLIHVGDYTEPIQPGVYTFFARYEIKDGFYTNWFPVSKPFYAGQKKLVNTIQGSVEYVNEDVNCSVSFVFKVNRPTTIESISDYKYLQIGFILKRENEEVARTWKKFPINVDTIYFDNDKNYIKEININEFLKPIYNNYNVKNLVNFKHKTYISNYQETNANVDLEQFTDKFKIDIVNTNVQAGIYKEYNGKVATTEKLNVITENLTTKNTDVITALDDISVSNWFYDYYSNSTSISNTVINNSGFLSIGSKDVDNNNLNELHKHWDATKMPSYEKALESCLGQIFSGDNTYKGIVNILADTSNDRYFPLTNFNVSACANLLNPNIETQEPQYGKVWYINELMLYLPDDDKTLDLIKIYKNIQTDNDLETTACAKNENESIGHYTTNINATILDLLKSYIYGITDNDEVILQVPDLENQSNSYKYYDYNECSITVTYTYLDVKYNLQFTLNQVGDKIGHTCQLELLDCYWRYQELNLKPNNNLFNNQTNLVKTNITTFIPEQNYRFYLHFVKNSGEITNGYFITTKTIDASQNIDAIETHNVFYPSITNNLSNEDKTNLRALGYDYYFISVIKNNTVIECTNQQCLEFDLLLNRSDKVDVINVDIDGNRVVEKGYYMDDTGNTFVTTNTDEDLNYFGSGGYLVYNDDTNSVYSFIKNEYGLYEKNLNLTKLTPYTSINDSINKSYSYFNCLGYLVHYRKPNVDDLTKYVSGATVFTKTIEDQIIQLEEIKESIPITRTEEIIIYSNYNLNFLRLNVSIQEQIRMYEDGEDNKREFTKFINSLNLKDLYSLSSSYKDYTTYIYNNYNPINSKYIFDNTIRASKLIGDEANNYIVTFNALDYYNVPTNKGVVVKLAGIGDTLLVHTQDSIFEFSGKPSIASDSAAQIVETDIFDSGITEVIPSEYGMAGLQHKTHSIITPFGYVFWDAQINIIYYYAGKGQIAPISDPIRKILDTLNPSLARFSYDYANDRFFINLLNNTTNKEITLSYNVKAKAFVSFHDFNYSYSVNTKNKTYYIKKSGEENYKIGLLTPDNRSYEDFYNPSAYIIHGDAERENIHSYVDILVNDNYEKIKTLDSISWICGIKQDLNLNPSEKDNLAEDVSENLYPGNKLIIYSDSCVSDIITIHNDSLKDIKDYTKGDYKKPVYNLGKFTLNYFRNTKHVNEQSLIYGKYFVIRLFFDANSHTNQFDDFKLENIELLYTLENYGKI